MRLTYALLMRDRDFSTNAFAGKRAKQDSAKRKRLLARERRLRKIGLSVTAFKS